MSTSTGSDCAEAAGTSPAPSRPATARVLAMRVTFIGHLRRRWLPAEVCACRNRVSVARWTRPAATGLPGAGPAGAPGRVGSGCRRGPRRPARIEEADGLLGADAVDDVARGGAGDLRVEALQSDRRRAAAAVVDRCVLQRDRAALVIQHGLRGQRLGAQQRPGALEAVPFDHRACLAAAAGGGARTRVEECVPDLPAVVPARAQIVVVDVDAVLNRG